MTTKILTGYKFVDGSLKSKNGECQWKVGEWKKHDGELKMCLSGFHASESPIDSLEYVYGNRWFRVETRGRILNDTDKFVASEMRLVQELPTRRIAVRFAVECAKRCLPAFEEKFPDDKRPRKAIEAAEVWLKNQKPAAGAARAARAAERKWPEETILRIIAEKATATK